MRKKSRIPNHVFSIFLFLLLFIPYVIKLKISEPFPAIIMPSGHGKIHLQDTIFKNYESEIKAIKDKKEIKITTSELFSNIPPHYHYRIINNNLGILSKNKQSDYLENFKNRIFIWKKNKYLRQEELKSYYKKNITIPTDTIRVIKKVVLRDIRTGSIINEQVISIKNYPLN